MRGRLSVILRLCIPAMPCAAGVFGAPSATGRRPAPDRAPRRPPGSGARGPGGGGRHGPSAAAARRMQGIRRATQWGYSLYEMEVYRHDAATPRLSPVHFIRLDPAPMRAGRLPPGAARPFGCPHGKRGGAIHGKPMNICSQHHARPAGSCGNFFATLK